MSSEKTAPADPGRTANLLSLLEDLTKLAVVFAAFGYVALRAHYNRLGLPLVADIGITRLSAEAFSLVVSAMALMLNVALPLAAVILALALFIAILRRFRKGKRTEPRQPLRPWFDVDRRVPLAAVVGLHLVVWWTMARETPTDIAVGELCRSMLRPAPDQRVLFGLVLMCALGIVILLQSTAEGRKKGPIRAVTAIALFLLVGVQLPMLFGATIRKPLFPEVSVEVADRAYVQGLLVQNSGDLISVWRPRDGKGEVLEISRENAKTVGIGRLIDLVHVAHAAALKDVGCR